MPWTNPTAAIGVDKPIRASTHLALYYNFSALAEGDPGAPRVRVPQALRTDETAVDRVLVPDGAGGLRWVPRPATSPVQSGSITGQITDIVLPPVLDTARGRIYEAMVILTSAPTRAGLDYARIRLYHTVAGWLFTDASHPAGETVRWSLTGGGDRLQVLNTSIEFDQTYRWVLVQVA